MGEKQTHGLKTKEKMAYACGDFGGVLTFSLISSFLTMFYTDCLHIPLAQITILMLIARIWDAINDPLWGGFIDSRKPTKWAPHCRESGPLPQATQSNTVLFLQFPPQIVQIPFLLPLQVSGDKGAHPPVFGVNGFDAG